MWHNQHIIFLTKDVDAIHAVTPTKDQKYPSTIILKYANVLAELIKSYDVHLINIIPY